MEQRPSTLKDQIYGDARMKRREEYGGYIEFETFHGDMLHEGAIALNCGRNALKYLCEARHIRKLYLPCFLCDSVAIACDQMGVAYSFYAVDHNFYPVIDETMFNDEEGNACTEVRPEKAPYSRHLESDEYLYVVNYYGQLSNNTLSSIVNRFGHVIVDNAHSYFQMPLPGVDTIYTCRKFFGVADGAFLYTDARIARSLYKDESFDRMRFLMGRFERSGSAFYEEYSANNDRFVNEPVKRMSGITENILHGLDYELIRRKRTSNYAFLMKELREINELQLHPVEGAFMYPLLIEYGRDIRRKLQAKKIYIPMLWPNVLDQCPKDSPAYRFAADILPLPVDQRYNEEDMRYIAEMIISVTTER